MNPNDVNSVDIPDCQVMLKSSENVVQIRDLDVGLFFVKGGYSINIGYIV